MSSHVPLVHVVRSGFVESEHAGTAVALAADGSPALVAGDPDAEIFPRSAVKPLQALAMLRCGLELDGEQLALAASSHSGEPVHLDGVRRLLDRYGLAEWVLDNTPDYPYDPVEAGRWRAEGKAPSALAQNCSGKHASMVAACVVNGWPADGYLDPDHPVQAAVRATLEGLTGVPITTVAVDGCGAPLFGTTLTGLARAFGHLASAPTGTPEHTVAQAIRAYPRRLGGTARDVTELLRAVPDLIAKDGAEAVWAAALPDGRAAAVKIADGSARAVPPVLAHLLDTLGAGTTELAAWGRRPVLGHGQAVGALECVLT